MSSVDALSRLPRGARWPLYLALQRAVGSRVGAALRDIRAWERLDAQQLEAAVEATLGTLLTEACARSPHYRGLGLTRRSGEPARDFLRRFPVLSRDAVRDRFADIVAEPLRSEVTAATARPPGGYSWLVVKTGGTTGTPTSFVHDRATRDWGRAARLWTAAQTGHAAGTPFFRLWGSEADLFHAAERLQTRVQRALLAEIPMNAFRAREAELAAHWQTLRSRPDVRCLVAYVDAAESLARYAREQRLPPVRLSSIESCAGTLTPETRALLSETFGGAAVFDKYGSRDASDMACECAAHDGLHVLAPCVTIELVNELGAPVRAGEVGRILVTALRNRGFPLIRYDIGDLARWGPSTPCACGLAWPRLVGVEGRDDEMLTTADGTLLTSVFVRHLVGVSLNRERIREWQLEQSARCTFTFRYVPRAAGAEDDAGEIARAVRLAAGENAVVTAESVTEIAQPASGKVRWIVNRTRRAPYNRDAPDAR